MPTTRPLVDLEALVVAALAADSSVTALVAGGDVATELPAGFPPEGRPFVQVFRATATTVDPSTGHLERAVIQANIYGDTKVAAWDLTAAVYSAVLDLPAGTYAGAVVTNAERITGPSWSPDPRTDAPRYTMSVAITAHPTA